MKLRATTNLTGNLERNLLAYAAAASAAGVAMAALTQPAAARVVYTPTQKTIGNHGHYNLDLNHDGTTDFVLRNSSFNSGSIRGSWLSAQPGVSNGVAGYVNSFSWALALKSNKRIGPMKTFLPGQVVLDFVYGNSGGSVSFGQWGNVKRRYLGLKFMINGKTHYGWARLNVTLEPGSVTGKLTGYAYETKPNKAILAGDEGTGGLGRLALGVAGRPK